MYRKQDCPDQKAPPGMHTGTIAQPRRLLPRLDCPPPPAPHHVPVRTGAPGDLRINWATDPTNALDGHTAKGGLGLNALTGSVSVAVSEREKYAKVGPAARHRVAGMCAHRVCVPRLPGVTPTIWPVQVPSHLPGSK